MKIKDLMHYFDRGQKISLEHSKFGEEFSGLKNELNIHIFGERDVIAIYTDDDIYKQGFIKIRITKESGEDYGE